MAQHKKRPVPKQALKQRLQPHHARPDDGVQRALGALQLSPQTDAVIPAHQKASAPRRAGHIADGKLLRAKLCHHAAGHLRRKAAPQAVVYLHHILPCLVLLAAQSRAEVVERKQNAGHHIVHCHAAPAIRVIHTVYGGAALLCFHMCPIRQNMPHAVLHSLGLLFLRLQAPAPPSAG